MKKTFFVSIPVILLIVIAGYLLFVNKNRKIPENISIYTQPQPLDTRFWLLHGQISKIGKGSLDIEVIKNATGTDYIFDDMFKTNILIGKNTKIKKFDTQKQTYSDMNTGDLKIGELITAYIEKATSTGYKTMILELFDK